MNKDPNVDEIWHAFNTLSLQLNVMSKCVEKQIFEAHALDSLLQHTIQCVHKAYCLYSSQHRVTIILIQGLNFRNVKQPDFQIKEHLEITELPEQNNYQYDLSKYESNFHSPQTMNQTNRKSTTFQKMIRIQEEVLRNFSGSFKNFLIILLSHFYQLTFSFLPIMVHIQHNSSTLLSSFAHRL